jgi:hypothetical protein
VAVGVHVNSAFSGYGGGVFNACYDGTVNHAVALVGWDDSQGSDGVWILRNSWGSWWGEDGYMRIEYECSRVGYAAALVFYRYDCNGNGIRDDWDIADGTSEDCNENWVPDECDIADGTSPDCNENGIPDECDVASGSSPDCNGTGVPDECELEGTRGINLEKTLLLLDRNHAAITALIPDRYDFLEGETGWLIEDGGNNMYDGGNKLNTSRATQIPYTSGVITPADVEFGPGSRYVTGKYPGLFVMIAVDIDINWFAIWGNLGADGEGGADGRRFTTEVNGLEYTLFVKRVFGAPPPSVNHVFIVPGNPEEAEHSYYNDTDYDRHRLDHLWNTTDLIYVLTSCRDGLHLHDPDLMNMVNELLANVAPKYRDCNKNDVPDECDVADQTSPDVNNNDVPDECECWGDLDGDEDIDLADLAGLLASYGSADTSYYDGDLDGDGDVDLSDLTALLALYGTTCE